MQQEDRFFRIALGFSVAVTIAAFLWINQDSVLSMERGTTVRPTAPAVEAAATGTPSTISPAPTGEATRAVLTPAERFEPVVLTTARETARATAPPAADRQTIERAVAAIEEIAAGATPTVGEDPLPEPEEVLVRRDRDGRLVVAAGTHRRYDSLVEGLNGVDVAEAVSALQESRQGTLSAAAPPDDGIEAALREAVEHLLEVVAPNVEPDMVSKGNYWGFADAEYEGLTAAQKHMLLMGRDNARVVRSKLMGLRELLPSPTETAIDKPPAAETEPVLIAEHSDKTESDPAITSP